MSGFSGTSNTYSQPTYTPVVVSNPPRPLQYCYMQTVDITQSGNAFLTKKISFILDTASTNVVDDLFLAEASSSSSGGLVANIKFAVTGIWSLCWTARFNASSSENGTWFSVQNSKFYNDTTGNRRLAFNGTSSFDNNAVWTGYVDAGDVFGLNAYSAATGNSLKALFGSCLIATLIQPTLPRVSSTPVQQVITS
jgi:hypothetical protein